MAILTSRTTLAEPAKADIAHIVDVSDTTDDPTGTSKQATLQDIGSLYVGNTVEIINQKSDLPAPSGGVITLIAGTNYVIGDAFSIGTDRIDISAGGIAWLGLSIFANTVSYTGTGSMFTAVDATTIRFDNVNLSAPTGTIFDFSNPGSPGSTDISLSNIAIIFCAKMATISDTRSFVADGVSVFIADDGFSFSGSSYASLIISNARLFTTTASAVMIDLGTSVTTFARFNSLGITGPAGAVGISGAAASANLAAGTLATVEQVRFLSDITPLSGIATSDIRWDFQGNSGLSDTVSDALISLSGNATQTVIGTIGLAVKVAGTFVVEGGSKFTSDTTGRATYDGERDLSSPIDIETVISSAAGNNKDITVYLALNGIIISNSGKTNRVDSADPKSNSVPWQITLTTGDFLEIFIANDTDTTNLIVDSAVLRIR